MDRRRFLLAAAAFGSASAADSKTLLRAASASPADAEVHTPFGSAGLAIPDHDWRMWPDTAARWKDDIIYLPEDVKLADLPVNPPTGGWSALTDHLGIPVTLPATVEQFYWGLTGLRPYHDEYKFETSDDEVKNGAYYGVSWWWRQFQIPSGFRGKRIFLHVRAMRQRAEVYVNQKLVGYSIMEELPFECDISSAVKPGLNQLAIRITNPGGRLDWRDGDQLNWGGLVIQKSHGFGGLDRALMLSAHGPVRISDCWALNTPVPRRITASAVLDSSLPAAAQGKVRFEVLDLLTGAALASREVPVEIAREPVKVHCEIDAPGARIWDLDTPHVYRLRATWISGDPSIATDVRQVSFGFRWFAVDGLGTNAMFRLNGRRVRIYTSISWGFWALNGLFPIPELAEKEVRVAKQFNLNTLNFHRNLGKEDVLFHQDRMGLMRCLEPGGGSQAVGRAGSEVDSNERYVQAKIVGMIRAFRSHPSVVHYILQNEARLDPANPRLDQVLRIMQSEDPSRSIVGNDGFVMRSPQVWVQAYSDVIHASGPRATEDGGAAGWWVDHTGHFSDVWQDAYYNGPDDFFYRSPDRTEIVEWGEMKGAASIDNHVSVLDEIKRHGGKSYDLVDHQQILDAYESFLDRHGFRKAFPTTSGLFLSIGRRAYQSWGQFMENVRICNENDMSAISGWESTAIENHSGLVDNFRDFKSDPRMISESLLPVRPVAKQRELVFKPGDRAVFDVYLLNDSNAPVSGELTLTLIDPHGQEKKLGSFSAPAFEPDRLSYLIQEAVTSEPLDVPGTWRSRLSLSSHSTSMHERELLVVAPEPRGTKPIRVGFAGISDNQEAQLRAVSFANAEPFQHGVRYDVIVASGSAAQAGKIAEDAEGASISAGAAAESMLPAAVLAAVRAGTPLLAITPTDGQAVGLAKQLAQAGAFEYRGMVGPSRASWMGSWYFVRRHPLYDGLPADQAMSIHYQVRSNNSNGWLVEGPGVEIIAAYSRDHDRNIGAGTLIAMLGTTPIVLHRVTDMHPVFCQRFLANGLNFLAHRPRNEGG